jgi:uncharacterized membrane protein YheB (UPF0754 family)
MTDETREFRLVELARDPSARDFLAEKLETGLARVSERTWGELLQEVSPERVSNWVVAAVRTEVAATVYRDGVRRLATAALDRPIGRPARLLPSGAADSIRQAASDPLWRGIQAQIPSVVTRLDVARRVEEKVLEFPVERMEELVRRVTDRELRMIIVLGYALGAFIGTLLVVLNRIWA